MLFHLLCYQTDGIWLPAAKHRHKTKIGGGRKRLLLKCCTIWGSRRLPDSRFLSSTKQREKKPFVPQKTETPNQAQRSCSILVCPPEHKAALWMVLRRRAHSWSRTCGAGATIATQQLLLTPGARAAANSCSWSYTGSICGWRHLWLLQPPEPESALACVSVH